MSSCLRYFCAAMGFRFSCRLWAALHTATQHAKRTHSTGPASPTPSAPANNGTEPRQSKTSNKIQSRDATCVHCGAAPVGCSRVRSIAGARCVELRDRVPSLVLTKAAVWGKETHVRRGGREGRAPPKASAANAYTFVSAISCPAAGCHFFVNGLPA